MKAELYTPTLEDEKFRCQEGSVVGRVGSAICDFITLDNRVIKCRSEPGVVYNTRVWFEKTNSGEATLLLLEYYSEREKRLLEKLKHAQQKVNFLKTIKERNSTI